LYEAATTIGAKLTRNILRHGAPSARDRTASDMRVQYDNARFKDRITNFDDYVFGAERDDFIRWLAPHWGKTLSTFVTRSIN
jgi:hypothetical protein